MKIKSKLCAMILLSFSLITLAGCVPTCPQMPNLPTSPVLDVQKAIDGGIILSKDDAVKLGVYIIELERGYQNVR